MVGVSTEVGLSIKPFDTFNLATHVGDAPKSVEQNRLELVQAIGGAQEGLHVIGAAHSANVALVDQPGDGVTEGVDALVTTIPNLGLLGLGADCAVVTFADEQAGVVAVAHCGWQGLVKGILRTTVEMMSSQGTRPESIQAQIGPSICGQCYEVDEGRARQVEAVSPSAVFESQGKFGIDIALGVVSQLADLGVVAIASGICTHESKNHFSFRRDGTTGRQGAAIVLRKNEA